MERDCEGVLKFFMKLFLLRNVSDQEALNT